jgi:hypothetical protein
MNQPAVAARFEVQPQFKPGDVTTEDGEQLALEAGEGFEFWWISCGRCACSFGQVIHKTERYVWCAHCDVRLDCPLDEREKLRTRRREAKAPN